MSTLPHTFDMDFPTEQQALAFDAVPTPVLVAAADGRLLHLNPAARKLTPRVQAQTWQTWLAELKPLLDGTARQLVLQLPGKGKGKEQDQGWVRVVAAATSHGGHCFSLQAIDAERDALAKVEHLQEMLDLARDFGRLGLWERDARTLEGNWDRQVHAFRGLAPDSPTPGFEESMKQVAQADRATLNRVFRDSLRQPGTYSHRYSLRAPDGSLRRVHSQWRVKADAQGVPTRAVGLLVDDTETLALAGVTGELESQLALAVDLGRIAIWRHDLRTQRMHYNAQAWSVLDLPPQAEGLSIQEVRALIHPDDIADVMASAEQALRTRKPTDMEARYKRADGSWRQVLTRRVLQCDEQGEPLAFIGVAMDVTGRHDAEVALRSAAERVALVTRAAGLGTWEIDLVTGESRWDEQMWLLRGLTPRARALTVPERLALIHPDDIERVKAVVQSAGPYDKTAEYEFRVVWPDGQVRWLATRAQTLHDDQGRPVRRIGVTWDMTDARNAAAVRQAGEVAQKESQAKSQFMARMSHELRTPLNAVLGFTQLLLAEAASGSTQRLRLEHVQAAGQHLLSLVNDVLDLAGLEGGEQRMDLQPVDLADVLKSSLAMLDPLLVSKLLEVHLQLPASVAWMVLADAARLRQVLLNLLSNAIKYNREGGRVDLKVEQVAQEVRLSVSDTGPGMNAEQLSHLFEPFNRLGAERLGVEGSGIGLTVAKSLTERMGGRLEVRSQAGQGSCFILCLQAALVSASAAAPASPALPEQDPVKPRPRQVLYIEDNPVNAMIIAELMARREDLVLHLAEDGIGGLARARALQPDLLLLDMQLPDINGLEVLSRLRADPATAQMPCFALSANAMPDDIERAIQAGADDYWTKPVDFAAFMAAIDQLFSNAAP